MVQEYTGAAATFLTRLLATHDPSKSQVLFSDLIHWSPMRLIHTASPAGGACLPGTQVGLDYASIIDHPDTTPTWDGLAARRIFIAPATTATLCECRLR